ncbi:MAG: hypothetical protein V3U76_09965 [Granulosicoccus sp.]
MADRLPRIRIAVVLLFALAELLSGARMAFAESRLAEIDVDPPLIEHTELDEAEASPWQMFTATVVDDEELDRVRLFYRFAGESAYSILVMTRVSSSSTWTTRVPTEEGDTRSIEYYIDALDQGGNRTNRGYSFNPMVRHIAQSADEGGADDTGEAVENTEADAVDGKKVSSRKKGLYYLAGAVAVVLIAGLARRNDKSDECVEDLCEIIFTVERPY